ncbi:hypothetical protein C2E23DRAFT_724822 [Lenzites betulinus]|nr:hypothetical protein C2E23DRAFT_724822 [Lenzites betulinus]
MNHFLALVTDEFLDLWDPGVYYTKTALRPQGRLARAALVPLVADLLAARQLSGFGPHNHSRVLCTVCTTPSDDIENTDPSTFRPRDLEQHRADAKAWLEARTTFEREKLFSRTGVRHSELLRLHYWNPLLYTVIDTMHNLYLGILQRHIRTIWGIKVDIEDGDASTNTSGAMPARPSEEKMAAATDLLLQATPEKLGAAGKAALYHLCLDRGIRRAGTISQLVKNLVAWVPLDLLPDYGDKITPAIVSAETTLRGAKASSALPRKKQDVLQAMCIVREIPTENATKGMLAKRLIDWSLSSTTRIMCDRLPADGILDQLCGGTSPSSRCADSLPDLVGADGTSPRHTGEAIGRDTLDAYMEDRTRMQLPSWVNPPPLAFGTKQHGKLSADQWRTLCVINLPVTLIRTWGFQEERRIKMLENYLELVAAVETFGLLEIDEQQIVDAEERMHKYLDGIKELYKGTKIQPNHHLALHIGVFLRLFGPVHSWRAFVFERFNFYLQSLNTNLTFGELETTFMMHSCRAANFRPLLRSEVVKQHMEEFSRSLAAIHKDDRRGMRLDAVLRTVSTEQAQPQGEVYKGIRPARLEATVYRALLERLALADEGHVYMDEQLYLAERPPSKLPLSSYATRCSSVSISGVRYAPFSRAAGDSNAMFRYPTTGRTPVPGRIEDIMLHTRQSSQGLGNTVVEITETFIVVRRLQTLDRIDAALDPYRKYPGVGGRLYYNAYDDQVVVLRCQDISSHFALTPMEHLVVQAADSKDATKTHPCLIKKRCVHVRPLDRVSSSCHGIRNALTLYLR